ncbi:MAG TPA: hypothetical protein VD929_02630 [Caulobacteraceae bacterium]|nr:hypothetical protein [Caulobacteraceae bacterium]
MRALRSAFAAFGALALFGIAACDNGPSAVESRPRDQVVAERSYDRSEERSVEREERAEVRQASAPRYEGRPLWSSNRRYGAEENARRHFERHGADLGTRTYEDYVAKAHAFVRSPPKGTLTLERPNGDTLLYDPKGNLFAVATRDGAPRTLFKPDDGMAYWEKQKVRESRRAERGGGDDDRQRG